jgi:hypothetical protein
MVKAKDEAFGFVSMLNSKTKQKIEEVNCLVTSFKAGCALSGTGWLYKQAQGRFDAVECAIYMYGLFMSYHGLSLGDIQMAWGIVGDENTLSLNIFLVGGFEDQWVAGEATRLLRALDPAKTTEIFQDPSNRNKKKGWIRNELRNAMYCHFGTYATAPEAAVRAIGKDFVQPIHGETRINNQLVTFWTKPLPAVVLKRLEQWGALPLLTRVHLVFGGDHGQGKDGNVLRDIVDRVANIDYSKDTYNIYNQTVGSHLERGLLDLQHKRLMRHEVGKYTFELAGTSTDQRTDSMLVPLTLVGTGDLHQYI